MRVKNKIYMALIHFPVLDKTGAQVVSAVTNLDVHDLARLARTYGVESLFLVTPDEQQRSFVEKIIKHWREGFGAMYNSDRKEALGIIKIVDSIEAMESELTFVNNKKPLLVSTSASKMKNSISFDRLRGILDSADRGFVILFGTGWGLSQEVFSKSDYVLEPIDMNNGYNHLSVRSAASIVLDRLLN